MLEDNIVKYGTCSPRAALYHMNNIYEVNFIVSPYSIDTEGPNKNEKSWGYKLTFFSVVLTEGEKQDPFSFVCF